MIQESWNARYQSRSRMFSGLPNPTLIAETADLSPGHALEIGCGEGADALWLAEHGWHVTATDIAPTALRHAAQTPSGAAHRVAWVEADLTDTANQATLPPR